MKCTVIVDNYCSKLGLFAEWAYCAIIESEDGAFLIDTAQTPLILMNNINKLKIDLTKVNDIVLSHGHDDHCAALPDILNINNNMNVWLSSKFFKDKLAGAELSKARAQKTINSIKNLDINYIDGIKEIQKDIFAFTLPKEYRDENFMFQGYFWQKDENGEFIPDNFDDDISFIVKGKNGYSLLLGCAHAGIVNIMKYAKQAFGIDEFYSVLGGFHMCQFDAKMCEPWTKELSKFKVKKWRPNHCTGTIAFDAISKQSQDVEWAGAGYVMEL